MSINKHIGAFSYIESKKIPIHEKFDETNSKHEKKRNLIQAKKHQDENASDDSDFLCTRFQMPTKHLESVTTIRHQNIFLHEVKKKDTNSLSRKQEKNAPINQVIFHQIATSRFFLINP